jgi:drug/metabolite transporter (DMT)-like permease
MNPKAKLSLFGLHASVLILSFASVFAKLASSRPFLSLGFFVFYGATLAVLGIYAIFWQRVLTHVNLSVAYASRGLVVVWALVWSSWIFNETITGNNIAGGVLILCGVYFAGTR